MYRRERKKTFLGNMYVDGVEVEREAREEDRRKEKRDNAVPGNAKQENV